MSVTKDSAATKTKKKLKIYDQANSELWALQNQDMFMSVKTLLEQYSYKIETDLNSSYFEQLEIIDNAAQGICRSTNTLLALKNKGLPFTGVNNKDLQIEKNRRLCEINKAARNLMAMLDNTTMPFEITEHKESIINIRSGNKVIKTVAVKSLKSRIGIFTEQLDHVIEDNHSKDSGPVKRKGSNIHIEELVREIGQAWIEVTRRPIPKFIRSTEGEFYNFLEGIRKITYPNLTIETAWRSAIKMSQ